MTVIFGGRRSTTARRGGLLVGIAALVLLGAVSLRSAHRTVPTAVARTRPTAAGPAGVAAAFRYPLGCLAVTIERTTPAYPTATLDRKSPCWRYGVYVTAVFHRLHGEWRLVLEARSSRCPPRSLPAAVRAQLAVCTRPNRQRPHHAG